MKRILLPTDYSSNAEKAMDFAFALYGSDRHDEVEFIILHIEPPLDQTLAATPYVNMSVDLINQREEKSRIAIQRETEKFRHRYPDCSIRPVFVKGGITISINEVAKDEEVDIIVMGAQGKGFVDRLIMGSVSIGVAESAPCSVLVVPGKMKSVHGEIRKVICTGDFRNLWKTQAFLELEELVQQSQAELMMLHLYAETEIELEALESCEYFLDEVFNKSYSSYFLEQDNKHRAVEDLTVGFGADLVAHYPSDKDFLQKLLQGNFTKDLLTHLMVPIMILNEKHIDFEDGPDQEEIDLWRTQLDELNVQFGEARKEVSDGLDVRTEAAGRRVRKLRSEIGQMKEEPKSEWDHFRKEMKGAIRHLKKAFQRDQNPTI